MPTNFVVKTAYTSLPLLQARSPNSLMGLKSRYEEEFFLEASGENLARSLLYVRVPWPVATSLQSLLPS